MSRRYEMLGDEEQPFGASYAPPHWSEFKPSLAETEAMAEWIEQQDYGDEDFPAEVLKGDEFDRALDELPKIKPEEHRSIIRGAEFRRLGRSEPWSDMLDCLRAEGPSAVFLSVVADLIEANVLHNRGALAKRGTITTGEARRRHERYVAILHRTYPGKASSKYQQRATDIIAYEVMRDAGGELDERSLGEVRRRVTNAKSRGLTEGDMAANDIVLDILRRRLNG